MDARSAGFGIANSARFATVTPDDELRRDHGCHDSFHRFTPLVGLVPFSPHHARRVISGGVGAGMYRSSCLHHLSGFIALADVVRTPEYCAIKSTLTKCRWPWLCAGLSLTILLLTRSRWSRRFRHFEHHQPGPHCLCIL